MSKIDALLRQVRKLKEQLEQRAADRAPPGMSEVKYQGVSGMLRQARDLAERDKDGNRVLRRTISLDDPRPASGVAAMLWDALLDRRQRETNRAAAGSSSRITPSSARKGG